MSAPAGGSTSGALDEATSTWFTTLCTGQATAAQISPKIKAATTTGSDADKMKAVSPLLAEGGKDFTDLAAALAPLPAPGFANGADYATKQIAALKEKAGVFDAAAASTASGDTSKMVSMAADMNSGPAVQALTAFQLPADVKAGVQKLPACAAVVG